MGSQKRYFEEVEGTLFSSKSSISNIEILKRNTCKGTKTLTRVICKLSLPLEMQEATIKVRYNGV